MLLAYSRADETDADEWSARLSAAAGYDPQSLVSFLRTLGAHEANAPGWTAFLSDHPLTSERVEHVKSYIADEHLTGKPLGDAGLDGVKRRLHLAPPPG